MEDPCLILANRFKQVQTLAATADAFFCLYSYVSKTPVQKISPVHFFWTFPEIPALWNAPPTPETLSPLQRLQRAVSRMCLYTSPRQGRLPGVSDMQIPMSRLERIVREVMAKAHKEKLDEAHMVTPGDPSSLTKMDSVSSKSAIEESTLVASTCFCCEAQSRGKADLILPGLQQWFISCTNGASRDVPDHDGYQELHYSHLSPLSVSSPDESSEESDEESSESTEEGSVVKEDCMDSLPELG